MARTHAGAPAPRRSAARGLAALTSLVLAAASLPLAAPAASAEDGDDLRVDLPRTVSVPSLVAASGNAVMLAVPQAGSVRFLASNDNGATFAEVTSRGLTEGEVAGARDGTLVTYVPYDGEDAATTTVYRYDFSAGTTSDPVTVPAADVLAVDRTTAVFADADGTLRAEDLAGGEVRSLAYGLPAAADDVRVTLAGGSAALVTATTRSGGRPGGGRLDLVPLDGGVVVHSAVIPGLIAAALRGDQVVYATATGAGSRSVLNLCFRSAATWQADAGRPDLCATAKVPGLADQRDAWAEVHAGEDWVQWSIGSSTASVHYVVSGSAAPGTPRAVADVDDERVVLSAEGDPERPLVVVADEAGPYLGTVQADGSLRSLCLAPHVPVTLSALELTPDRVAGLDDRPNPLAGNGQAWQRDLDATGIGAETSPFPRALDLGTSGARTLVDDGGRLRLYDRGTLVRTLSRSRYGALAGLISGPYYPGRGLSYVQAIRVDGKVLKTAAIRGMFGSLVLVRTNAKLGRYDVVDLANGGSVRVRVPVRYRLQGFTLAGLSGDWAYGYTLDADGVPYTLAVNYRTGVTTERYGLPVAYGEGFVAVKYATDDDAAGEVTGLEVWNPGTGQAEDVPDADWDQVSTDGTGRLAYSTRDQLVVRTLTVVPVSAPRLLGVLAPTALNTITAERSWALEVDTTKALGPGRLSVLDADGDVVWAGTTPPSADGSLRGLSWDGRDPDGVDVTPGDYTWRLVAPAADGSGNVVRVDGRSDFGDPGDGADATDNTNGVSGTIHVVKQFLGTVAGATPTISGTARVDRVLKALPGSWSPSGTTIAYQWLRTTSRGTTAIPGATAQTYTVQPADLGARVSVRVTGTRDGWKPAAKTSKRTAAVAPRR
jgi:hypothetical protein